MPRSLEVHLAARPHGLPTTSDFRVAEVEVRDPGPGEVLIRNTWMSVDPYMRPRMDAGRSYIPPFELDAPLEGGAIGVVEASGAEDVPVGTTVRHMAGWRQYAVLPAKAVRAVEDDSVPPQAFLGVLGMPGLTSYVGLVDIAELREGDVVFVSGAAGAVGSIAGQIAKLRGHAVIGSAGTPEKVRHVREELGFDACLSYRDGDLGGQLAAAAPDGIDVYFDNVGGEHLGAALRHMRVGGRVAMCGSMSTYNADAPEPGPSNLFDAVRNRVTMRGFVVTDHGRRMKDLVAEVGPWVRDGRIIARETVVEGVEHAPEAFIGLMTGANTGKMLVRVSE